MSYEQAKPSQITAPEAFRPDPVKRGALRYWFGHGSKALDGAYHVAGGMAPPQLVDCREMADGAMLVCGRDVATGRVVVFEEWPWHSMSDVMGLDNTIAILGAARRFNEAHTVYGCRDWWVMEPEDVRGHLLPVWSNGLIQPKPCVGPAPSSTRFAYSAWQLLESGRLIYRSGRMVMQAIGQRESKRQGR
jgi:hypothetical protein